MTSSMFANVLVADSTEGRIEEPLSNLSQLQARLRLLDGRSQTLVMAFADDAHIAIGGSAASGLVVYVTFDNETFHQLVTRQKRPISQIEVVAGGQPGRYEARYVVDISEALLAAESFVISGALTAELDWEQK